MKHRVSLTFVLNEEVTPDIFASRIAQTAANGGALRPGEGVEISQGVLVVSGNEGRGHETLGLFDEWPPRPKALRHLDNEAGREAWQKGHK